MNQFTEESLSELTVKELTVLARMNYSLPVNTRMQKLDIIDQIMKAQAKFKGNERIRVLKTSEETEVPAGHCKIMVQPGKYNPNNRPVIGGHNFRMFSIPVNREVIVPNEYLNCLKDAVRRDYFKDPDSNELVAQDNHSYPFSILERGPEPKAV